ncbi:hypothetical protein LOAG_14784 [Loa loa]|uniref:Uncharacterized protein n=1 Tax=Loa loa TaxID=7209 RepID=A0A1S0TH55_LOALO|nr:hypothetical protein LOAG_14784 [Loa loa]EFO13743.1 hypothetical protein LOAG_14784 [Loa loa]
MTFHFFPSNALFFHTENNTEACETNEKAGMVLSVFDTSYLLQYTTPLPMCTRKLSFPYIGNLTDGSYSSVHKRQTPEIITIIKRISSRLIIEQAIGYKFIDRLVILMWWREE